MAIHNKPVPKPAQRPVQRDVAQRPAQSTAGRSATKPAPAQRSQLQGIRDVSSGKTVVKQAHMPNATYVQGRPQSPLASITKPGTGSNPSLIPHDKAVNYLNHFLAKTRKA